MTRLELRVLKWFAEKKIWAKWGRVHAAVYRMSGGRLGHSSGKITNLLLTTTGRKSGKARTVPLSYIRDDDQNIVIVASNGGADRDPAWWINLRANPSARIQIESEIFDIHAREANEAERERLWPRLIEANFFYSRHLANTDRLIPIVLLSPKTAGAE